MRPHTFYLGAHHPNWLAHVGVPLFVSRRALFSRRSFPRAVGRWALDSGGYSELEKFGRWSVSASQYATEVRLFSEQIGVPDFAAPQDWMCEPWLLRKTGLSIPRHQALTVRSFLELRDLAPALPWIPVLQGWTAADYWRHIEMYDAAGISLQALPLVGVGSLCRRQALSEAGGILSGLFTAFGLRHLHGFGFKISGLRRYSPYLASADSMAWSKTARYTHPLAGCPHRRCNNCLRFALLWRSSLPEAWL